MKLLIAAKRRTENRRAPRGARGLKRSKEPEYAPTGESRPARGAWIETRM